jgi:serine protease
VLDTGVRFDHPDLLRVDAGGQLLPGYDMISDVTIANDGDGRDADPSDPGDWVTEDESLNDGILQGCFPENSSWHGTQVSGVIGALTDNGIGMAAWRATCALCRCACWANAAALTRTSSPA